VWVREGLPMLREPAFAGKRRQDAESAAGIERAEGRMPAVNVRRRGWAGPNPG